MNTLCVKPWKGLLTKTTDGHLMLKTVKGAVSINYWWIVSMCLIYNHTFCLLTSIYVLLNYASARPILFSLVLNFMYGNLNLTVLFKFIVYMFCLLIVRVYFYVGFKWWLEFCFDCLFLVNSKYILLHFLGIIAM